MCNFIQGHFGKSVRICFFGGAASAQAKRQKRENQADTGQFFLHNTPLSGMLFFLLYYIDTHGKGDRIKELQNEGPPIIIEQTL